MASDLLTLPGGRHAQYWQGGAPDGPAVFFFHGCPDTRHAAFGGDEPARRLGMRLVAVNRPGYGASDAAASTHTSVADDVVAVANLLGIDRFAVLGMSVGGPYALACAARYPDRVRAAAAVAAPGMTADMDPPWPRNDPPVEEQELYRRLRDGSADDNMELIRPGFSQYVANLDVDDPDDEALARRFRSGLATDAELVAQLPDAEVAASTREALAQVEGYLRDAAVMFRAWDFRPGDVRCPTTLWYGELDDNHPVDRNGRWLADHVPGSTLSVFPGTGHLGALILHWEEILRSLA
jgi:pimeloyl-ACP methyl ester carboxylesterase